VGLVNLERKPVPDYEDRYYLDPEIMRVVNKKTGRPLKPQYDKGGYAEVQLWKNNKGTHKLLHRLFAEAYVPNPDNLQEVNHKDENPRNFALDNLEWCTHRYNQNYGTANERRGPKISAASRGKPKPWVTEQKSVPIVAVDDWGNETKFTSARDAARQLNLDSSTITAVIKGRRKSTGGFRFYYERDMEEP
jgi:hypothetical protein